MNERAFERLIESILKAAGASQTRVVPRSEDKGADVIALFKIAGTFEFKLAIQAKYYQPHTPVGAEAVDQLASGMEAERADLGMVLSTGVFSDAAKKRAQELEEQQTKRIQLMDGGELAAFIVDGGLFRPLILPGY
jgi:restriction endonuclease Mrr